MHIDGVFVFFSIAKVSPDGTDPYGRRLFGDGGPSPWAASMPPADDTVPTALFDEDGEPIMVKPGADGPLHNEDGDPLSVCDPRGDDLKMVDPKSDEPLLQAFATPEQPKDGDKCGDSPLTGVCDKTAPKPADAPLTFGEEGPKHTAKGKPAIKAFDDKGREVPLDDDKFAAAGPPDPSTEAVPSKLCGLGGPDAVPVPLFDEVCFCFFFRHQAG